MSTVSYALSVKPEMYGVTTPAPPLTRAKIRFAELVRPDGFWPQPYSIEQAFQAYRWMIKTGKGYNGTFSFGVYDLLSGSSGQGNTDLYYTPIRSLESLRRSFHFAILGRGNGPNSSKWRSKEGIAFGNERILSFKHYTPFEGAPVLGHVLSEAQIKRLLEVYFNASGNLRVQLNSCHAQAVEIQSLVVRVSTHDFKFRFDLDYGYDGSGWWHTLAAGEQFLDTFGEALTEFERVSGQNLLEKVVRK